MLQPTRPWRVACCICHNIYEKTKVGLRATLTYLDSEKYKINYVFDMFSNLFLISLRDVISGLSIRDQIKHNQIHYWIGTQPL